MKLSLSLDSATGTSGAALTARYWVDLARRAEDAGVDMLTLGDSFAPTPRDSAGRPDAVAVLSRVAPQTRRIGLVPTVTTTHTEPFHTSSAIATLDHVSAGRAGWLVAVSAGAAEAEAFGRKPPAAAPELWQEASDAAEVAARLWDSWQDDAEIRDTATGRFIDRDRLHYVEFTGTRFSVKGPSIVPRPPQGRPPVVVALSRRCPPERWRLAARQADVVLLTPDSPDAVRSALDRLRRAAQPAEEAPSAHGGVRSGGRERPLVLLRVDLALTGPRAASPQQVAESLTRWHARTQADGFHLVPGAARDDLPPLADEVLPLLRAGGVLDAGPVDTPPAAPFPTLRDRLGLPRPASRYAPESDR